MGRIQVMIHQFQKGNLNITLDIGSGAVHVLDDLSYEMLQQLTENELKTGTLKNNQFSSELQQQYSQEDLQETFGELCQLVKEELLYSDDSYAEFEQKMGDAPIKALCLHIAHDCNLRCKYCFASTGEFGGTRKFMDTVTACKAIDILIKESGNRHNLEVDFFGGEPMMNFQVVKDTVVYARSLEEKYNKKFKFTLTTNGVLLKDEDIAFINKEMGNVVLSIDGRKEINDVMRPTINGKGSYDVIMPNFQKLIKDRLKDGFQEYYVRGTYTKYNTDFDKDILSLYNHGFDQISIEPVVGPETDDYAIQTSDLPAIAESYERLMQEMIERNKTGEKEFNFFHFMLDLDNGPCAIKRLKGCGSGNEYIAVTPDGEIYPCHQFVGNTDFIMGNIYEGINKREIKEEFAKATLFNKPTCQDCWAKFFCSGGCNANNFNYADSIYTPYELTCILEKMRLECAIVLKASELLNKNTVVSTAK